MKPSHRYLLVTGRLKRRSSSSRAPLAPLAKPRRRSHLWPWLLSFGVAFLLHGLVVPLLSSWMGSKEVSAKTSVRSVTLSSKQFDQNRRIEFDIVPKPPEEKKPPPKTPTPPGQLVKLAPPDVEQRPDKADYKSEHARRVQRETRARRDVAVPLHITASPKVGRTTKVDAPPPKKMAMLVDDTRAPAGPTSKEIAQGKTGPLSASPPPSQNFVLEFARRRARPHLDIDLSPNSSLAKPSPQEERQSTAERTRLAMGVRRETAAVAPVDVGRAGNLLGGIHPSGASGEGFPNLSALRPSHQELVDAMGMPARNHLPNVESADSTALNTWRWQHAPFFNRIRDQLYRVWDPHAAIAKSDPMAYDVTHQTRQTVLLVTIDREGRVTDSIVDRPSGVHYLDTEAIRAFDIGGPFPNPPAGLFGDSQQFSFLFGFSVDGHRQEMDFDWRPY